MSRIMELSASAINAGFISGQFSAVEVAQAALDEIAAKDGLIHAYLELCPEQALATARALDADRAAGRPLGSLAAVPVGFKDNMNMLGTHTTCASRMLENYVSPFQATCVDKTLQAGAIPLGKLNMDEFAFGSTTESSAFGPSRNPWDLERVPGGSSGGSAAAVASGMACIALGSDTGGSIRQPASFCGVVGMKPSYGMVSRYGVVAFGSSLDQVGPFGRNVRDVALTLNAISGYDPKDSMSQAISTDFCSALDRGIKGMRIGVVPDITFASGVSPEVAKAVREAVDKLSDLGAQIVEVALPHAPAALSAYYVIGPCEAFSNLSRFDSVRYGYCVPGCSNLEERYCKSRGRGFGAEAKRRIMMGSYLLSSGVYDQYYYPALKVRTLITQDFEDAFKQVDALVMPSAPRTAFKLGEMDDPASMYLSDIFTISVNIAGNCALSLPVALGCDSGLPVGFQIIGGRMHDATVLQLAAALERSCNMADRIAVPAKELL